MEKRWVPLVLAGLAGGTFLTGLALSALNLNPLSITMGSSELITAGATLIGAVVGGGLSVCGTIFIENRRQAQKDRAAGRRLLSKIGMMVSNLLNLQASIDEQLVRLDKIPGGKRWQVIAPRAGSYRLANIDVDDITPLIDGRSALQGKLIELEMNHNAICEAWAMYNSSRRALVDIMPLESIKDGVFISEIKEDRHQTALMRMHELETLLESIITKLNELVPNSLEIAHQVGKFLREHFDDPKFPLIQVGES